MTKRGLIITGIGCAALAGLCFFLFQEALSSNKVLWGPDTSAYGVANLVESLPEAYVGWWYETRDLGRSAGITTFIPQHLMAFVPPMNALAWFYMASIVGTCMGFIYLLYTMGLRGPPLWVGGIAMAFSGHTVSLISAGHLGKLEMAPYAVLFLAGLLHGIRHRSLWAFALAGLAEGFALATQPDIAVLFGLMGGVLGIIFFFRYWPARTLNQEPAHAPVNAERKRIDESKLTPPAHPGLAYVIRNLVGAGLALLLAGMVSYNSVRGLLGQALPGREQQAETIGQGQTEAQRKWEFATNWSLPPEDMLEFVAPFIFGVESNRHLMPFAKKGEAPYWGRLGRTRGWLEHHRGLMNLRQHTVYLGVIQLVLGIYAVVAVLMSPALRRLHRFDVLLWGGTCVVALLLALGRYFPLYRLFYSLPIPYLSSMRAPVKFLHLVEVSLCVLVAMGVSVLLRDVELLRSPESDTRWRAEFQPTRRRITAFSIACGGMAVVMLLAAGLCNGFRGALMPYWQNLGLGNQSQVLMQGMRTALAHGASLFAVSSIVFLVLRLSRQRSVTGLAIAILIGSLMIDLASVARHYVNVWNDPHHRSNALIEKIKAEQPLARVALPVRQGVYGFWNQSSFVANDLAVLDLSNGPNVPPDVRVLADTLDKMPLRLWQVTSTANIVGPVDALASLTQSGSFAPRGYFALALGGAIDWRMPTQGEGAWLQFKAALPRAVLCHGWQVIEKADALVRMADPAWNPALAVLVSDRPISLPEASNTGGLSPVAAGEFTPTRIVLRTDSPRPGILLLNDLYDPDWRVSVDGRKTDLLRCNFAMRGVEIPAGAHECVFTYRKSAVPITLSLAACGFFLIWSAGLLLQKSTRRRRAQDQ